MVSKTDFTDSDFFLILMSVHSAARLVILAQFYLRTINTMHCGIAIRLECGFKQPD